jgi:peptide deformylase
MKQPYIPLSFAVLLLIAAPSVVRAADESIASEGIVLPTLAIVKLGHPALRLKSSPVTSEELSSSLFQKFLDDLARTCVRNSGAGIAAPQVGVNKRVIVVHVDPTNPRYPNKPAFPLTIIVNPEILAKSSELESDWEGDLSAGLRGIVPRPKQCKVRGLDRHGKKIEFDLTGFHARVFQHEIDHLDGVFLLDRVERKETIAELPEWERFWKGNNPDTVISSYTARNSFDRPK